MGCRAMTAPQHHGKAAEAKPSGEDVVQLREDVKRLNDQYLRTLAEFENTKKRLHREKDEFIRYAAEAVVRELLPICDSLDQALVAVDKQADADAVVKGVHLIHRQLLGLLKKEGVTRIPTVGEPFDPHRHEAVGQMPADDGVADGTVVEEVQPGYLMHDTVIRPAMVRVAATSNKRQATVQPTEEQDHSQGLEEASNG